MRSTFARFTRLALPAALALGLSGCVISPLGGYRSAYPAYPAYGEPGPVVDVPPPQAQYEAVPASPGAGHVWIGGYWGWNLGRHVWIGGRWAQPPHGHGWVPGYWGRHDRGWRWNGGHWRRH